MPITKASEHSNKTFEIDLGHVIHYGLRNEWSKVGVMKYNPNFTKTNLTCTLSPLIHPTLLNQRGRLHGVKGKVKRSGTESAASLDGVEYPLRYFLWVNGVWWN